MIGKSPFQVRNGIFQVSWVALLVGNGALLIRVADLPVWRTGLQVRKGTFQVSHLARLVGMTAFLIWIISKNVYFLDDPEKF